MNKNEEKQYKKEQRAIFWERNKRSHNYLLKKEIKKYAYIIFRGVLLFGLCFLILQPLFNKISISFMEEQDLYDATVINVPRHFTTINYTITVYLMDYWKTLFNSTWVSLLVSIIQIIACTLVGYGFARYEFPFKKFWFACVLMVIIIPPQTISNSLSMHFMMFDIFGIFKAVLGKTINLKSTVLPYLLMSAGCMGLKNGLYIFMIRQYFRGIPKELEEAAYVDGCGKLKTFVVIMLPDAKPILTSCFLFSFVWQWTDGFYSNMFLQKVKLLTDTLTALASQLGDFWVMTYGRGSTPSTAYEQAILATGMLITILPLLIIYIFAQKGFVESLSQTGLKM